MLNTDTQKKQYNHLLKYQWKRVSFKKEENISEITEAMRKHTGGDAK